MLLSSFAIIITKQFTCQSRDHSIRHQCFTIHGPLRPCVYLAPLWRYGVSKVGRMHGHMCGRTHGQTLGWLYTLTDRHKRLA